MICDVGWNKHYRSGEFCDPCWKARARQVQLWRIRTGRTQSMRLVGDLPSKAQRARRAREVAAMIRIRVHGTPAPQGSKRHVGGGRMVEMSKAVGPWREAVRMQTQREITLTTDWATRGKYPLSYSVSVTIVFLLARPKSHYRTGRNAHLLRDTAPSRPAGRPDVDKLARATLDGLTMGGAFADDAQVVDLHAGKVWADDGMLPGCYIEIEEAK